MVGYPLKRHKVVSGTEAVTLEVILAPKKESFGSNVGVMFVLCCSCFNMFLGWKIQPYLEDVPEVIFTEVGIS